MVALLAVLLGLLILPAVLEKIQYAVTRGRLRARAEVARQQLESLPSPAGRFSLVAQSIAPTVVGIKTVQIIEGRSLGEWAPSPLYEALGEGSGVIMDEAGYIVTNFHVIYQADRVQVQLADGETIDDVDVVGKDPLTDIAVLKISARGLTAAPWGDSDSLQVGEEVIAVGNPFGFDRTVTAGIISAKDRRQLQDESDPYAAFKQYLQTDAAVNPGNSGGPLVNLKGEVVGINTAIVGPTFRGISFAIPSRVAREIYEKIRAGERIARGWLGVEPREISRSAAARLGLDEPRGALVAGVVVPSPAERAGMRPGDVIIEWDGKPIGNPTDLKIAVARTQPGARVTVRVIRQGRSRQLAVTVGERPLDR